MSVRRGVPLRHAAVLTIVLAGLASLRPVLGQDTTGVSLDAGARPDHSPRGALWRAAAVPGWGQLYNRQYYKAPIVWGGLAGVVGSALYVNRTYLRYRHAFHWLVRESAGYEVPAHFEEDYLTLIAELGLTPDQAEQRSTQLTRLFREHRDNLRRNRDLLYIGIGLFYGLSMLDAYVSAHLLDFDVGEDLTLSLRPVPGGLAAGLRMRR